MSGLQLLTPYQLFLKGEGSEMPALAALPSLLVDSFWGESEMD